VPFRRTVRDPCARRVSFRPRGLRALSSLPEFAPYAPPATSSGARQTARRARGQCTRARISRRHDSKPSPASDGACAAGPRPSATAAAPCASLLSFSPLLFAPLLHPPHGRFPPGPNMSFSPALRK